METMKLIPMTQFVLEHPASTDYEWQLKNHLNYANFLSQPIELWMFVPCSEAGEVLEEPTWESVKAMPLTSEGVDGKYWRLKRQFDEAKSRCLFEGFTVMPAQSNEGGVIIFNKENNKTLLFIYGNIATYDVNTVEDSIYMQLPLTQTAKEIIFGTSR